MKETKIVEEKRIEARKPILIEGLPGLGYVGKIVVTYLIQQLKAERFASLYSPFFPYYVLSEKGDIRLLRMEFYHAKNESVDLIFLTGDCQPTTSEGQYEVASRILDLAKRYGVDLLITLGGFNGMDESKTVGASTNEALLKKLREEGVDVDLPGNPIVGTTGILLSLARFHEIDAVCLLGETRGYPPSLKPAKKVLQILSRLLGLKINLKKMDEQILKSDELKGKLEEIAEKKLREKKEVTLSYIS